MADSLAVSASAYKIYLITVACNQLIIVKLPIARYLMTLNAYTKM